MRTKRLVFGLVMMAAVIGLILLNRLTPPPMSVVQPQEKPVVPRVEAPAAPVVAEQTVVVEPAPSPKVQPAPKRKKSPQVQAQNNPPAKPGKEPLHDPDARDALARVGMDSNAEKYWLEAIFDTSLPDNERGDLMEDLNETSFADPRNLTTDDLPLIVSRLQIIQQILPQADPFMRGHLAEAYKDLGNMYSQAGGQ